MHLLHWTEPIFSHHTLPLYYPKTITSAQIPTLTRMIHRCLACSHLYPPVKPLGSADPNTSNSWSQNLQQLWSSASAFWSRSDSDLIRLEDDAVEVLRAIEQKFLLTPTTPSVWLNPESGNPSWLDATLLAYLHVILHLSHTSVESSKSLVQPGTLQARVKELDHLCRWADTHFQRYLKTTAHVRTI